MGKINMENKNKLLYDVTDALTMAFAIAIIVMDIQLFIMLIQD